MKSKRRQLRVIHFVNTFSHQKILSPMNKMRSERTKLKAIESHYVFSYKISFIINSWNISLSLRADFYFFIKFGGTHLRWDCKNWCTKSSPSIPMTSALNHSCYPHFLCTLNSSPFYGCIVSPITKHENLSFRLAAS